MSESRDVFRLAAESMAGIAITEASLMEATGGLSKEDVAMSGFLFTCAALSLATGEKVRLEDLPALLERVIKSEKVEQS